ncbi:hypothetical protein Hanom_Chr01g00008101 [Helianthus anomalus]
MKYIRSTRHISLARSSNDRRSSHHSLGIHPHPHTVAPEVPSGRGSFQYHDSINQWILFLNCSRCRFSFCPNKLGP